MGRHAIETIMGSVVLIVAAMFLIFAWNTADIQRVEGYELKASFLKVGGLSTGGDVRISGIRVGSVTDTHLDAQTYQANVSMSIKPDIELPTDTKAVVSSDGLMGGAFVRLEPGSSENMIEQGGRITNTQDLKSLEELVGEVIFMATDTEKPE